MALNNIENAEQYCVEFYEDYEGSLERIKKNDPEYYEYLISEEWNDPGNVDDPRF